MRLFGCLGHMCSQFCSEIFHWLSMLRHHVLCWPGPCKAGESESEVTQSCPTLREPMDCSLPGSSVHVIFPGNSTGVDCLFLLQGIFPTQGLNLCLSHCRQMLYCLSHQGSPLVKQGGPGQKCGQLSTAESWYLPKRNINLGFHHSLRRQNRKFKCWLQHLLAVRRWELKQVNITSLNYCFSSLSINEANNIYLVVLQWLNNKVHGRGFIYTVGFPCGLAGK